MVFVIHYIMDMRGTHGPHRSGPHKKQRIEAVSGGLAWWRCG